MTVKKKVELLQGTLDMLVLKILTGGPMHGYAIVRRIQQASGDLLVVEEGSLYPALYRLEKKDLLKSEWGMSELERRAKFYSLTERGHAALSADTAEWMRFSSAVTAILSPSA